MAKLFYVIFILLSVILLSLGYFLITIPGNAIIMGIKQPFWFGVGQSVIASALVSLIMLIGNWADKKVTREDENALGNRLKEYLTRQDELLSSQEALRHLGLRQVHEDRYLRRVYQQYQATVSNRLDLLGLSLKHFQKDVGGELIDWVNSRKDLSIRLLVINPTSAYCNARDREEGDADDIEKTAQWALQLTEKVLALDHERIQIKWYNTLPTINVYRLDDVVFIGAYLLRPSHLTATLELDVGRPLAKQFVQHFDDLWNSDSPHHQHWWTSTPSKEDVQEAHQVIEKAIQKIVRKRNAKQTSNSGGAQQAGIHSHQPGNTN